MFLYLYAGFPFWPSIYRFSTTDYICSPNFCLERGLNLGLLLAPLPNLIIGAPFRANMSLRAIRVRCVNVLLQSLRSFIVHKI